MKTDTLKKSLLDYAIKGKLTAKFRRENSGLNAFDELKIYNDEIKQKRKNLEKEFKKCEKEFKLKKAPTRHCETSAESISVIASERSERGNPQTKQELKSQIQILKKEIAKCKEITPLNLSEAPFEIPSTWAWVKLGDICEIVSGTSYGKDDLSDEGIRILRGGNINKNTQNLDLLSNDVIVKEKLLNEEKSIQQGDIVITGTNDISNIAKCAFASENLANTQIGAFLRIIRIAKEQNAKYIFYIVASGFYEKYIQSCVSGTVSSLLNIKNEYIENFLIPLPPLKEQQEIVKKLDLLVTLANDFAITKENLKRIEKRIEKRLLKLALEGSLSKRYRHTHQSLSAHTEIQNHNKAIKEKRKKLEKELKTLESKLKKAPTRNCETSAGDRGKTKHDPHAVIASERSERGNPQTKHELKSQIQSLKKELTKCKEIIPLMTMDSKETSANAERYPLFCHEAANATSRNDDLESTLPVIARERSDRSNPHTPPFEIPSTWAWVKGCDIFLPIDNTEPQGDFFKYIDIDSIDNKNKKVKSPKTIETKNASSRARRPLEYGDVLFSMVRPYLENIALIDETLADCIASTGFFVCRTNILDSRFLYYLMTSPYVVYGLNSFMKGDNSPSIVKDDILNFNYPLPPLKEQEHITQILDTLFTLKKGLRVE
ncbi:restriction endonuclease subunit S [Helicobacter canis]|uniref:Type I restriction-modification enzyme specificity subunit S n=1 Tax=Helicobacter canis TaxID=29419 RepID=A0A377J494_9HELI|nr:restriction endonuclease subunit S [Helicobacter canis]STO97125.1 type I restriction-modification enzyme specificity subunit S [Helicobacter canis]